MEHRCELCFRPAKFKCGACKIPFCSVEHQKLAYRSHRILCGKDTDSSLPYIYQPDLTDNEFGLITQLVDISEGKTGQDRYILSLGEVDLEKLCTSGSVHSHLRLEMNTMSRRRSHLMLTIERSVMSMFVIELPWGYRNWKPSTNTVALAPFYGVSFLHSQLFREFNVEENFNSIEEKKKYADGLYKLFSQELFRFHQLFHLLDSSVVEEMSIYMLEVKVRMKELIKKLKLKHHLDTKIYEEFYSLVERSIILHAVYRSKQISQEDMITEFYNICQSILVDTAPSRQ